MAASLLVVGCTYDFDAPFSTAGGPGDAGVSDATADRADAATQQDAADAYTPPPCDPAEKPSASAIFVSSGSGSDQAAGTSAAPVQTISTAIQLAGAGDLTDIYVDEGVYTEAVSLTHPVVLHGGWTLQGASWTRDCDTEAQLRTVIKAPAATVMRVSGFTGPAGLEDITLTTTLAKADAGESMIALSITGPGILFRAANIDVTAANGGDGAAPETPADPGALSCNGHSDCGTGESGSPGPAGQPGKPGVFGLDGYVPGDGGRGSDGTPGQNGTPGGEGSTQSGCDTCGSPPACETIGTGDMTSGPGSCGCGGKPGLAGDPGRGGGASVGILVDGQGSALAITTSRVGASDGGDGSAGVAGPGGTGSEGKEGYSPFCGTCIYMAPTCGLSGGWISGGSPGGPGGPGGTGGKGGGGSGGPSFGIVAAGGATTDIDAATEQAITVGKGGQGAEGAANGASSPVFSQP